MSIIFSQPVQGFPLDGLSKERRGTLRSLHYRCDFIYNVYNIKVQHFDWSEEKNEWLLRERNLTFELCVAYIEQGYILDILVNKKPRNHQKVFILNIDGYAYRVPFVEDPEKIFLKTAYPSRKDTKKYLT